MQHNDTVIAYKNSLTDAYEKKKSLFKRHFSLKTCAYHAVLSGSTVVFPKLFSKVYQKKAFMYATPC